jgi:hypothetical protein
MRLVHVTFLSLFREAFTDTDEKSALWQSIATQNLESVVPALKSDPCIAKARSKDGR